MDWYLANQVWCASSGIDRAMEASALASSPPRPTSSSKHKTMKPSPIQSIFCIGIDYVGGPIMDVIADRCPDVQATVVDLDAKRTLPGTIQI